MSNLIESMIHENVQFSESKKVKKSDKKVVKESKKKVKEATDERKFESEARDFIKAIRKLASNEEALENLENYLAHHFDVWLRKYAFTPVSIAWELTDFAEMNNTDSIIENRKKVNESVDVRDNIDKSLHTVEQDAQGVYESIMQFKESVRRVLWYINNADLSETEYSECLRRLMDNMYMYGETMYKLKDTSSELGRINQALLGFPRGTITIKDLMREL